MAFAAILFATLCAILFTVAHVILGEPGLWGAVLGYIIVGKLSFWIMIAALALHRASRGRDASEKR